MIETFTALLFAHVLADFVFQTRWMIDHKRRVGVLLLHTALVLVFAQAALGVIGAPILLVLAAAHLLIDAIKIYTLPDRLSSFLADQGAHLVSLVAVAVLVPNLWQAGIWATCPGLLPAFALLAGVVIATRAGSFAIEKLMAAHKTDGKLPAGLENGGKTIGYLERGLIFALVLVGQPAGIGFLIAAKSILRFGSVQEDRAASEYVIIGTLASFGWALIVAYLTRDLIALLPPLEITAPNP